MDEGKICTSKNELVIFGQSEHFNILGPVGQKANNTIQRINRYPENNCQQDVLRHPPDRDSSTETVFVHHSNDRTNQRL